MLEPPKVIFTKREIRQIIYLVLFGIVIIISQIFQFINTKNVNERYYAIVNNNNKLIVSINSILLESSILQRSLLNLNMAKDSSEVEFLNKRISDSETGIEKAINEIKADTLVDNKSVSVFFDKLKSDYGIYKANFQIFLQMLKDNDEPKIDSFRKKELRNTLDAFQKTQQEFLELLIKIENNEIKSVSSATNKTGWKLLIAGNGILFLILLFLIYILYTEREKSV